MWTRTLGNALFARELLAAAVESASLTTRSDIWTLEGPFTAPPRLRELIAGRLRGVRADERTALDLLAVAEPLPFRLLLEMVGGETLERLEERGLLVLDDGTVQPDTRLSHPLIGRRPRRRARTDQAPPAAAGPRHRRVRPTRCRSTRATAWCAGASTRALDVSAGELLSTARRYILVDTPLAESLTRRALAAEGDSPAALITLAEIMTFSGRPDDAAALLASLQTGSSSEDCLREVDLALVLAFGLNRSRDAAERLERLLDGIDDAQWGHIAGQIPLMWLLAGEIHRARARRRGRARRRPGVGGGPVERRARPDPRAQPGRAARQRPGTGSDGPPPTGRPPGVQRVRGRPTGDRLADRAPLCGRPRRRRGGSAARL